MNRQQLIEQIRTKKSFLCVGLDTDIKKMPPHLLSDKDPIFTFNKNIIDATAPYCVAYKPNLAFYEAFGLKGIDAFERTIDYLKKNKRIVHKGQIIGSVILTANPITKGHEYLINIAKSKCDILYVFVVEDNSFEFTTTERFNLVKTVIKNPDIIVLTTGNLMTAKYTFPAY